LFNAHGVEYLVVGAYALAFHGVPRYTGDLDLWIRPDATNAASGAVAPHIEDQRKWPQKPKICRSGLAREPGDTPYPR